ncbi:hypothetical protein [Myroides odoratimimus]|uniref:hypothetical protein n=1 Tax=Myroides odoratimimus TaxID=76832 RepID=UPI002575F032|nr:hypothetical protein [Myroides odoratimimus]MDM1450006.1 hypothetical protein [Myroides odoratimimus]
MYDKPFDIIKFSADKRQYIPASLGRQSWMKETDVLHTEMYAPEQVHLVRYNYSSTTFEFNVL